MISIESLTFINKNQFFNSIYISRKVFVLILNLKSRFIWRITNFSIKNIVIFLDSMYTCFFLNQNSWCIFGLQRSLATHFNPHSYVKRTNIMNKLGLSKFSLENQKIDCCDCKMKMNWQLTQIFHWNFKKWFSSFFLLFLQTPSGLNCSIYM